VVIGRNQNPWIECDVGWLTRNGIPLLRRISGGGAVWHDLGNLNISFILPRKEYLPERFLDIVLHGLHSLGIAARRCERQSLWHGDRKIAGSAFTLTGKSAIVHACLLVDADLDRLRRSLRPPRHDLRGRFLPSVPAHVLNLSAVRQDLVMDEVQNALLLACQRALSVRPSTPRVCAQDTCGSSLATTKYGSWEWTYGRTAEFTHHSGEAFLTIKHGRIASAESGLPTPELIDLPYDRTTLDAVYPVRQRPTPLAQLLGEIPPSTIRP
jgi:lipoate-protein ligase A